LLLLLLRDRASRRHYGIPKIREGDHIQIGNTRIRLGGIDAPSVDQLCLKPRASAGPAASAARTSDQACRDKSWTCHTRQIADRRGRQVAGAK